MMQRPNYTIRLAETRDIPELCIVHKETWLDTYPNAEAGITIDDILEKDFDSPERHAKWQQQHLDRENTKLFVTEVDGKVVGFCEFLEQDPLIIEAIYILPKFQHQGIGRALFTEVLNIAGGGAVALKVATYNSKARNFYQKLGFEPAGEAEDYLMPNGKRIPIVKMIRPAKTSGKIR